MTRRATTETGRFQLTILERALAQFSGFLLELLDCPLIDTTALVDEMAGGGGLAGIDVSDNCNVELSIRQ